MIQAHHLPVTRTARYCTLGPESGAPKELWLVCHGQGQLAARFLRHFELLDDGTRLIVAPEGLSRYYVNEGTASPDAPPKIGASWMTREDRLAEIDDYLLFLDALFARIGDQFDLRHSRVIALGFSQGVATICRWVERGTARVDQVVLWAGGLPPDLRLDRPDHPLRALRPIIVLGEDDPYATPAALAEQQGRLRASGLDFELVRHPGGHRLDYDTLRVLAARWR